MRALWGGVVALVEERGCGKLAFEQRFAGGRGASTEARVWGLGEALGLGEQRLGRGLGGGGGSGWVAGGVRSGARHPWRVWAGPGVTLLAVVRGRGLVDRSGEAL